jgi:hypothetical protein
MAFGAFSVGTNPGEPPTVFPRQERGDGALSQPLSFGEREVLRQQTENRRGVGMTWAQHEAANLRAITTDADIKRPRIYGAR